MAELERFLAEAREGRLESTGRFTLDPRLAGLKLSERPVERILVNCSHNGYIQALPKLDPVVRNG